MRRLIRFGLVAAACLAAAPAMAADFGIADATLETEAVPPGGWHFAVTPYAWFTGVNGTITARGRQVQTSASFVDIVQNADQLYPFMGYFEASKDRFSIFGDFIYTYAAFSGEKTVQKNPIAGLKITTTGKASVDMTLSIATLAANYDVIQAGGTSLGLYAGARYWYTDADLNLKITREINLSNLGLKREGKYAVARSGGTDWIDPIVGVSVQQEVTPRTDIALLADVGGFGVGSEFSWHLFGGLSTDIYQGRNMTVAAAFGYRMLSVDYQSGSGKDAKEFDMFIHGPLAGLAFRW